MSSGEQIVLPGFGAIERERVLAGDELFVVVRDKYPISRGHTLIVARRAAGRFAELTQTERMRLMEWVAWAQNFVSQDGMCKPDGFNLGVNDGMAAGQTISQFHFHVIPRYAKDVFDPRGGIRWVLPLKAKYW